MFHEILHNVEAEALCHVRCTVHISIRDPSRFNEFTRPSLLVFRIFCLFVLFVSMLSGFSLDFDFSCILICHHTPSVHHSFLFRQMPRQLFNKHWVQYERSLANSSNVCIDPIWLHSYCCGLPNGQPGAWGVNGCHVKQFHRNSFVNKWNGYLLNRNSLGALACTSLLNGTFSTHALITLRGLAGAADR